jgi:hypothetical protein
MATPSLITPELIVYPVRHHSPACAWQLQQLLARCTPSAILVEGPASFTPLIPLLTHAEARMPLAIYTYAVQREAEGQERRCAAYYPFCDYSPELIALQFAAQRNVLARFIDLDFTRQHPKDDDEEAVSLLDERHYRRSRYLQALAQQLGCRNHEELWEHLFEAGTVSRDPERHMADIATYCQLARIECTEEELETDGTLAREAEMARQIRKALAERTAGTGPVLAVVGGFHAVVLPDLVARGGERPPPPLHGTLVEETSALIRYGYERLDRLNGYAAGMTSPAWHQRVWELLQRYGTHRETGSVKPVDANIRNPLPLGEGRVRAEAPEISTMSSQSPNVQPLTPTGCAPLASLSPKGEGLKSPSKSYRIRTEAALAFLSDIAEELRERHRLPLPMPVLAAAYEQALRLAELRGRPGPLREDVVDAVTSCFVKGEADADGALVLAVARRRLSGQAFGKVPPGAGTPPLVKDFHYRARRQRLKIDDSEPHRAVLDIYRRPEHRLTSRLLHGLSLLAVPFAVRTAGPDFVRGTGLERIQEHWDYSYSAATEAALVEASVFGSTLPLAVAHRYLARLEKLEAEGGQAEAGTAAALAIHACVLGLHDHLPKALDLLRRHIADEARFESAAVALGSLHLLWESRQPLEACDVPDLPELLQLAYQRAIFLGRGRPGAAGKDGGELVLALTRIKEVLTGETGTPLDSTLFWALLEDLNRHHDAPLVRGAAAGLLYGADRLSDTELALALDGHLNGLLAPKEAVTYLRGLLQTAREAAWQQPALLRALDGLLRQWDEGDFVALLPELRLAFAAMTPRETDRIAEAVAELHGVAELGRLLRYDLSAADIQRHLELSRTVTEILAADGLAEWIGS